jgi:hypothetical protein
MKLKTIAQRQLGRLTQNPTIFGSLSRPPHEPLEIPHRLLVTIQHHPLRLPLQLVLNFPLGLGLAEFELFPRLRVTLNQR